MSRRGRAAAFASAAAICAGLAAGVGAARPGFEGEFGELREVLVTTAPLARGQPIDKRDLEAIEVRRVPASFLPPGALSDPAQLAGRRPAIALPPGSYVLAAALRLPGERRVGSPQLDRGARAVEIEVERAGALVGRPGSRVDVIVTTEPGPGGGAGRTYVAARAVGLLALDASAVVDADDPLPSEPGAQLATLALSRAEALRLIQAESFARSVRLLAH